MYAVKLSWFLRLHSDFETIISFNIIAISLKLNNILSCSVSLLYIYFLHHPFPKDGSNNNVNTLLVLLSHINIVSVFFGRNTKTKLWISLWVWRTGIYYWDWFASNNIIQCFLMSLLEIACRIQNTAQELPRDGSQHNAVNSTQFLFCCLKLVISMFYCWNINN
jgi:hypothetical protein